MRDLEFSIEAIRASRQGVLNASSVEYPSNRTSSIKYSPVSFLPLSLLQQLKNVIIYFYLVNSLLQTFPAISTNSPLAGFIPTCWIILMGLLFDLLADLRRWRTDKAVNQAVVTKLLVKENQFVKQMVFTESLQVGDLIELENDQTIPADCIVVSTEDPDGKCYISTETLDGEQNLKPKVAAALTQGALQSVLDGKVNFKIEYSEPNKNIYDFGGILTSQDGEVANLEFMNFIPRGTVLRNS